MRNRGHCDTNTVSCPPDDLAITGLHGAGTHALLTEEVRLVDQHNFFTVICGDRACAEQPETCEDDYANDDDTEQQTNACITTLLVHTCP
ncbi:hypothetical protein D3C71_1549490 [compost metagenome]